MSGIIRDLWNDGVTGRFVLGVMLLTLLMIPLVIWVSIIEQDEWESFAETHSCKIVGRVRGSTQTGVGHGVTSSGQMGTVITTTTTPSKTGYLCDDGVTYWR